MEKELLIPILVACLGSSGFFAFVQYLIQRRDLKKRNPVSTAVQALLRDRLLHLCEKYLAEGEVTLNELQNIAALEEAYKGLGGNSFVGEMVNQVKDLTIKKA